jgi:hypothetical protein
MPTRIDGAVDRIVNATRPTSSIPTVIEGQSVQCTSRQTCRMKPEMNREFSS